MWQFGVYASKVFCHVLETFGLSTLRLTVMFAMVPIKSLYGLNNSYRNMYHQFLEANNLTF